MINCSMVVITNYLPNPESYGAKAGVCTNSIPLALGRCVIRAVRKNPGASPAEIRDVTNCSWQTADTFIKASGFKKRLRETPWSKPLQQHNEGTMTFAQNHQIWDSNSQADERMAQMYFNITGLPQDICST